LKTLAYLDPFAFRSVSEPGRRPEVIHERRSIGASKDGMNDRFVRKLRHGARLMADDEALLRGLAQGVRRVEARRDIVIEGDVPRGLTLILDGWACSYRQLENGKRQIISIFLPGDLCQPFGTLPRFLDHSLSTFTPVQLATVTLPAIRKAAASARVAEALWWDLLVAAAIDRERVVSLGRRTAAERLGHLFCELHVRLGLVGLADETSYDLPITQTDLADVLGITPVHVNRSLQDLRGTGMISLKGRRLTIHDVEGLRAASFFDPVYLHLDGTDGASARGTLSMPVSAHGGTYRDGR
jgi:CRP-like cAMP-binding protein